MANVDAILAAYEESAVEVKAAVVGMSREQWLARPVAGKWSTLEVLCHLVDAELMVAGRVRAALLPGSPKVAGLTGEQLTAQQAAHERDGAEEVALFELIRKQTARIVRASGEAGLLKEVTILKPDGTEIKRSVQSLIEGITPHAGKHLVHVYEKRKAMGI